MEDQLKLRSCPFCGSAAEFHVHYMGSTFWSVYCIRCGMQSRRYQTKKFAAEKWNCRSEQPLVAAVVDFVARVNRRAEANMEKTGKLEGAHYAAMQLELSKLLPEGQDA